MQTIILAALFSYSVYWFLNFTKATASFRAIVRHCEPLVELYKCSFCVGFWIGLLAMLVLGYGLFSVPLAFVVAIITYFLYIVEKLTVKYL